MCILQTAGVCKLMNQNVLRPRYPGGGGGVPLERILDSEQNRRDRASCILLLHSPQFRVAGLTNLFRREK